MDVSSLTENSMLLAGSALLAFIILAIMIKFAASPTKQVTTHSKTTSSQSGVSATSSKKKNKKKKKLNSKEIDQAKPSPAPPVDEPKPIPAPKNRVESSLLSENKPVATKIQKKKKKNKKVVPPSNPSKSDPTPSPQLQPSVEEDSDDEEDDFAMLTTFAKGGRAANKGSAKKKQESQSKNVWTTIPKKSKSALPALSQDLQTDEQPIATTETLALGAQKVPILIGPKGVTIQKIQMQSNTKIDVDKETHQVTISGSPNDVFSAVKEVQRVLDDSAKQEAHTITLSFEPSGVKAIIGKGGSQIQKIQGLCPDCRIQANIEAGTVSITGPTEKACAEAAHYCRTAVYGESNVTVDLKSRAMVMAVCGRGFSLLNQMQRDTDTKVDVTGTTLTIRGDADKVQQAQAVLMNKMNLYHGVTISIEAAKIGLIIGKGAANLKSIQERSGAQVEVIQTGSRAECRIVGEPKAVQTAQGLIQKSLNGEVELKPGEERVTVDLGVGAPAVIGKGGSNIAELEKKHHVKLNVQNAVCHIVGKKEKLPDAKAAIEAIVAPLIKNAAEDAQIREKSEAMTGNGDNAWSLPQDDALAGW